MRNGTLDHARLAAAAGIVLFHSGAPGTAAGHAALPFFLMLLVWLAWTGAARDGFAAFAAARLRRLLLPWAVWSAIYGAFKLAQAAVDGRPAASEFAPWMWLAGPAIHLWFLPYAAAACLAVWPLARLSARLVPEGRAVLAAGLAAAAVAAVLAEPAAGLPRPFAQWAHGAPAVLLGAALAALPGPAGRAALVAAAAAGLAAWDGSPAGAQLLAAAAALWLCLALPLPDSRAARRSAEMALTVYLAHPLLAALLLQTHLLPEASLGLALATLAATLLLAGALTAAAPPLRRNRGTPRATGA